MTKNQEKNTSPDTLRFAADAGNAELAALCGPLDENLRQMENILGVRIMRRGDVFRVSGEREAADDHLRVVAAEAFARSGRELNAGQERQLQQLLEPLRRDIEQFRRRVDDCYSAEARERFALNE